MANGMGRCWWPDGSFYEGYFQDNMRNRKGEYVFPGGKDRYLGEFLDNKRSGEGEMRYSDGTVFKGFWENDMPSKSEECEETYPNGSKYVGRYMDGL